MRNLRLLSALAALAFMAILVFSFGGATAAPLPQVVSHTIQAVTVADLMAINITRQTNGEGGTAILATGVFDLKDGNGNIVDTGTVTVTLTAGQVTSLNSFSNAVLVPAMNAQ